MEVAPIRVWSPAWAKGPARIENGEIVLDEERADVYTFKSPRARSGWHSISPLCRDRGLLRETP
jgi:hypothetical protein